MLGPLYWYDATLCYTVARKQDTTVLMVKVSAMSICPLDMTTTHEIDKTLAWHGAVRIVQPHLSDGKLNLDSCK